MNKLSDTTKSKELNFINKERLANADEVLISKSLDNNLTTIIVDFDKFNLSDRDDMKQALGMLKNFKDVKSVYTTSKDNTPLMQLYHSDKLYDWTVKEGERFLCDLGDILSSGDKVQLCGIYRELCIVEVASLIKNSALDIEPIIIDNDSFSISAKYSVEAGDTLENRLLECGFIAKYI